MEIFCNALFVSQKFVIVLKKNSESILTKFLALSQGICFKFTIFSEFQKLK